MSVDSDVTSDLIQTLENGKDGFAKAAEKLQDSNRADLAPDFLRYSQQRAAFATELHEMAKSYGDELKKTGTVAGAVHRGWLSVKDALAGSDPDGVLDAAEQGEDHAVKEYEKALEADLSSPLREVVARQSAEVRAAHDHVKSLRQAIEGKD